MHNRTRMAVGVGATRNRNSAELFSRCAVLEHMTPRSLRKIDGLRIVAERKFEIRLEPLAAVIVTGPAGLGLALARPIDRQDVDHDPCALVPDGERRVIGRRTG